MTIVTTILQTAVTKATPTSLVGGISLQYTDIKSTRNPWDRLDCETCLTQKQCLWGITAINTVR